MTSEMKLEMKSKRFTYNGYRYPLHLVVFEQSGVLGRFDSLTYQLGLNKHLMYKADTELIKNILRHELAHLMTFIEYGRDILVHGPEFKMICDRYGWDPDVKKAASDLTPINENDKLDIRSERIISKVQKLLKLASSNNPHEAELATIKANQLLLKHNLELLDHNDEEDEFCLKRVITGKRVMGKHRAIYEILTSFYVHPVFNHGIGGFYLEVVGSRANVELADYVAQFLDYQLEKLWDNAKKEIKGKVGIRQKNSYMMGVAKGYTDKIELSRSEICTSKDLVRVNKGLKVAIGTVYGRLGSSRSQSKECQNSKGLGHKDGKNLSINPGLKQKGGKRKLLSFW